MTVEESIRELEVDELYEAIQCLVSGMATMLRVCQCQSADLAFSFVALDDKMPEPIANLLAVVYGTLRPCSSAN